jgi:hypothetical protein
LIVENHAAKGGLGSGHAVGEGEEKVKDEAVGKGLARHKRLFFFGSISDFLSC